MSGRLRRLVEVLALTAGLVAALLVLQTLRPAQELADPLGEDEAPFPASCDVAVAEGAAIDSTVAVECPDRFDGQRVSFTGEVVGDVITRADGSWVQLNDDDYALEHGPLSVAGTRAGTSAGLAVWIPSPLDEDLLAGRSRQWGTVLTATGTFLRADPRDGGGTALRADRVDVHMPGQPLPVTVDPAAVAVALLLFVAAGAAWFRLRRTGDPRHPTRP